MYDGWYIDAIRMVYSPSSYDGVPFGKPEFEVWLARRIGPDSWDVPLDGDGNRPCASEAYGTYRLEHFNYDDPPNTHYGDFLFSHGTRAELNSTYGTYNGVVSTGGYLFITENDDTACPYSSSPSTSEFNHTDLGDDDEWLGWFALPVATSVNVFDWTNPYARDPGRVRAVYSAGRTF